ncbi:MAG: hypothetical protein AB1427_16300 [Thermodesulfobacteriota bacterium]
MALFAVTSMKHVIKALVVVIIFSCLPGIAEGQSGTKTLTVMGNGTIRGENVEAARDQAISGSLEGAVSRVVESEIPFETLLKNFQAITRLIHTNTSKFIQGYKVLTENRSGQLYSVLVQATVSLAGLEEQLLKAGIMFGRKALPKILFVVAEKNRSDMPPGYWWGQTLAPAKGFAESMASEAMKQKGFTIIEPTELNPWQDVGMDLNKPDLTNPEAIELGRRLQAEVVIIGRSIVHLIPNTMSGNVRSYQGMVTVRAVRLDTGEEIAASMQTALTANSDELAGGREALSKAGAQAGSDLASQILKIWHKEVNQPTLVEVVIQGSSNLLYYERFRQALMELQGVRGLQIKEIRPDESRLIVDFEGNAEKLAASLMLKAYGAFGINITEIALNHLKIQLTPR